VRELAEPWGSAKGGGGRKEGLLFPRGRALVRRHCGESLWGTVQYVTVQCSAVQCSIVQYSTVQYCTVQCCSVCSVWVVTLVTQSVTVVVGCH